MFNTGVQLDLTTDLEMLDMLEKQKEVAYAWLYQSTMRRYAQHTYQPYSKPTEEFNYLKYLVATTDMPGRDATVAIQKPEG